MIKRLLLIFSFFVLATVVSSAQWTNTGAWPNANFTGNNQGMAVDPDGKVWSASYYSSDNLDSIPKGDGTYLKLNSIFVFNADGTPASFSPIRFLTYNGVTDTTNASVRGMASDVDGNIIYANGWWRMYKIDYKTGNVLAKVDDIGFAPTKPASDAAGNIYMAPVLPANPVKIYDKDLNYVGNAVESVLDYGRCTEVSADGNTIYVPRFGLKKVIVYQRPDEFSAYDSAGTILDGAMVESIIWHPVTGHLWASCGSYFDKPTDPKYSLNTWYALDVSSGQLVDSLKWVQTDPALANDLQERPRTIGFAPDGLTAYVGCFNNSKAPMIQKVVKGEVSAVSITFAVDMGVQAFKGKFTQGTDQISVAGTFNEWSATATPMTDTDGDTVYTVTVENFNVGDNIEFKFVKNGADWETIDNRTYTVPAANSTFSAYWDNDESYAVLSPVNVTFSVNMEFEIASGRFTPATDTLSVRGSFNGWGSSDIMSQSVTDPSYYEFTKEYNVSSGEQWGYKFAYTSGGAVVWETGDNYIYQFTADDVTNGTAFIDRTPDNFNSRNPLIYQDVVVKFEVDMNGAKDAQNGNTFASITNVAIAGAILPLQWPGGGWPDTDQDKVFFLKDDGTQGDQTSGDNIWTVELTFGQYSSAIIQYKYGANWGGDNHGSNDNENAVAQDHFLHLGSWITHASVRNTFGIMGDIEPYETTDVEKTEKTPTKYELSQNYPNPFNPNTTIQFSIPEAGFVTLKVYDILGKEVATLLNEEKGSGVYNVTFDASNLPSGTYIYKISTGNFTSTRKMLLLK